MTSCFFVQTYALTSLSFSAWALCESHSMVVSFHVELFCVLTCDSIDINIILILNMFN